MLFFWLLVAFISLVWWLAASEEKKKGRGFLVRNLKAGFASSTLGALVMVGYLWVFWSPEEGDMTIASADLGGEWPLTVEPVRAYCPRELVFAVRSEGEIYPLNGVAENYGKDRGWQPLEEIWKQRDEHARYSVGELISAVSEQCAV